MNFLSSFLGCLMAFVTILVIIYTAMPAIIRRSVTPDKLRELADSLDSRQTHFPFPD